MSEETGGGRAEMERRLVERSLADDAFRQRLLAAPKAAVEETADTIYLVLPLVSTDAQGAGELSDRELETVAGGWDAQTAGYTCGSQQTRCGVDCV